MSTNQMVPVWLVNGGDMSASITSDTVRLSFEDNVGIQVKWTGTPTGTLAVQVSMDPDIMGWIAVPFTSPDQPAGSAGSDYYEIEQTSAGFIRLVYTRASGSGTLYAKIALKSV